MHAGSGTSNASCPTAVILGPGSGAVAGGRRVPFGLLLFLSIFFSGRCIPQFCRWWRRKFASWKQCEMRTLNSFETVIKDKSRSLSVSLATIYSIAKHIELIP